MQEGSCMGTGQKKCDLSYIQEPDQISNIKRKC